MMRTTVALPNRVSSVGSSTLRKPIVAARPAFRPALRPLRAQSDDRSSSSDQKDEVKAGQKALEEGGDLKEARRSVYGAADGGAQSAKMQENQIEVADSLENKLDENADKDKVEARDVAGQQ